MTDATTISETITEEEIAEFVKSLEGANEPKCQIRHDDTTCTIKVVSRLVFSCENTRRDTSYLMCQVATDVTREMMRRPRRVCGDCSKPLSECWKIIPV